ncbi:glycosyltransferase family 4 protein [Flavobacterium sp. FlaQc-30]|uniref:glycosyltransferase family 4 protein n=1 Tax=Flavobacterium sp. FlaQc-30 TaxID=3374179 RepID=UPI0037568719
MEQEPIKKQNILGITGVWTGAYAFFYEGVEISKGMPAFNNVFLRLLNDKRVDKLHLILFVDKSDVSLNIPEKYTDKIVIYPFNFNSRKKIFSLFLFLKVIIKGISIVNKEKINQIVGFGSLAGLTAIIGKLTSIPDYRRLYGSFLINEIKSSKLKLFLKHPLEYICFAFAGKGLLITNDGTKGNVVFDKLGSKKLPFFFPLNGVDQNIKKNATKPKIELPNSFLSYVARINDWKRQHLLVQALAILKKQDLILPKTFIIGSFHDQNYIKYLKNLIKESDLLEDVFLIDGLPISEVHYVLERSLITYSLYHTSNLGNVFLESMKLGTPVIALNDTDSLSLIDKNAFFELKDDDPSVIADATLKLLKNDYLREELSKNAEIYAEKNLLSWDERALYEINIILD